METITATLGEIGKNRFLDLLQGHVTQPPAVKKKNMPVKSGNDPLIDYVYAQANKLHPMLLQAGIPEPAASYGLYATYHETAAYSSPLYKDHNNASGIKFAKQAGAVKGANGYAYFNTLQDWANAYAHELKKRANPAGATSLEDFATRLKANGYYEDSFSNYLSGLKRARLVLKVLPAEQRAGVADDGTTQNADDLDIPGSKDYSKDGKNWWSGLEPWQKGGIIGFGALVVILAVKQ